MYLTPHRAALVPLHYAMLDLKMAL